MKKIFSSNSISKINKFNYLTSYSIKSNNGCANDAHLRNWVIEVSSDEQKWIEIDRHTNDSSLNNNKSITCNFNVKGELLFLYD